MNTTFMKSENSKTSGPNVLILKFTQRLNLGNGEKSIALLNLRIYYTWTWKNMKSSYNNNNYQLQHGMINLNYKFKKKTIKRLIIHQ